MASFPCKTLRLWPDFTFLDFGRSILRYQRRASDQQRLRGMCCDMMPGSPSGGTNSVSNSDSLPSLGCCQQSSCHDLHSRQTGSWKHGTSWTAGFYFRVIVSFLLGRSMADKWVPMGRHKLGEQSCARSHVGDSPEERISSFIEKRETERRGWVDAQCGLPNR